MTYPVDDKGNPRVDFVWGNMAMQPNDQRDTVTSGPEPLYPANGEGNFGWDATFIYPSEGLYAEVTQSLSVGDKDGVYSSWDNVPTRTVSVPADNHSVALTGYSNYPAYLPNYAGDGDTGLEALVPNIEGLTEEAASDLLLAAGWYETQNLGAQTVGATEANAGKVKQITSGAQDIGTPIQYRIYTLQVSVPNLVGLTSTQVTSVLSAAGLVGNQQYSSVGATSVNNNTVKSQDPAASTMVNPGSTVNVQIYNYVVTANTNIAGFSQAQFPGHQALTGDDVYMFLFGRTTKPSVGNPITLAGNSNASLNQNFNVITVEDNDSYNTGGTVVKLTAADTNLLNPGVNATNGTWINL